MTGVLPVFRSVCAIGAAVITAGVALGALSKPVVDVPGVVALVVEGLGILGGVFLLRGEARCIVVGAIGVWLLLNGLFSAAALTPTNWPLFYAGVLSLTSSAGAAVETRRPLLSWLKGVLAGVLCLAAAVLITVLPIWM